MTSTETHADVEGPTAGRGHGAAVLRALAFRLRATFGWIPAAPEVPVTVLAAHRARRQARR